VSRPDLSRSDLSRPDLSRPDGPPLDGVGYQIYPRSFLDRSGDGIGDLAGIEASLDHLVWLGVDVVWLSPIYPSPMADFGYDVADHTGVDPVFGSLDDVTSLIEAAHARDLQVWLDWVPNHTSDQHPWFLASRSSRQDPKRDWYVWRDPGPGGGPPNNWTRHFADGAPAWTLDEATGQYYLHLFLPEQPDLNWDHPEVRSAMADVLRTWKARGIDGFRADVVHLIGKDPAYPDDEAELVGLPRAGFHDRDETLPHLREIRAALDEPPAALMVGEVNLPDAARVVRFVGDDLLPLAFHFGLIHAPWDAESWRETIRYVDARFAEVGAWPTLVVGNHDNPRVATRLGSEARARAAAVVLLTLRGVPFLYAGDELGLEDAHIPPDRVVDPGGRDGCRAPIPWDDGARHGWAAEPWLPWPPDADRRDVASLRDDPTSILHLHRHLLADRRASAALRRGDLEVLDLHPDLLAYRRRAGEDERVVIVDQGETEVTVDLAGTWRVVRCSLGLLATHAIFDGRLVADQAVVLRPA
jgi:alpha-glucosidase